MYDLLAVVPSSLLAVTVNVALLFYYMLFCDVSGQRWIQAGLWSRQRGLWEDGAEILNIPFVVFFFLFLKKPFKPFPSYEWIWTGLWLCSECTYWSLLWKYLKSFWFGMLWFLINCFVKYPFWELLCSSLLMFLEINESSYIFKNPKNCLILHTHTARAPLFCAVCSCSQGSSRSVHILKQMLKTRGLLN